MPDDDWALAQGTVDFRNEERMARHGEGTPEPAHPGDPYIGRVYTSQAQWLALEAALCTCDPDEGVCTCGWDEECP